MSCLEILYYLFHILFVTIYDKYICVKKLLLLSFRYQLYNKLETLP